MMVVFIQTEMAPCCVILASLTVMAICSMCARKSRKVAMWVSWSSLGPSECQGIAFRLSLPSPKIHVGTRAPNEAEMVKPMRSRSKRKVVTAMPPGEALSNAQVSDLGCLHGEDWDGKKFSQCFVSLFRSHQEWMKWQCNSWFSISVLMSHLVNAIKKNES